MKNKIKVLFIDDNDLDDEVRKISRTLTKQGKDLDHRVIDVSQQKYKEKVNDGTDRRLITRLIIDDIQQKGFMDVNFDIIACDFNFADDYVNGYDLMCDFHARANHNCKKIRKARILFYTGQVKDLNNTTILDVKRFVSLKVDSIVDRPNLVEKIVRLSNTINNDVQLERLFLELLEPHKDKIFKNTFPPFSGKSISAIIKEVEKETPQAKQFLKCLTEQTVANLIDLQGN